LDRVDNAGVTPDKQGCRFGQLFHFLNLLAHVYHVLQMKIGYSIYKVDYTNIKQK